MVESTALESDGVKIQIGVPSHFLQKQLNFMIFQNYLAGSALNDQKCSNFSSEGLKLSVEVSNYNLNQFSDFLEGLFSKTAHCWWVRVLKGIDGILELLSPYLIQNILLVLQADITFLGTYKHFYMQNYFSNYLHSLEMKSVK